MSAQIDITTKAILLVKPDNLAAILLPVLDSIDEKKSEGVHMSTIARELGIDPVVFRYAYRRAKVMREKKQDGQPSKKRPQHKKAANREEMPPALPNQRKTRKPKPAVPPELQAALQESGNGQAKDREDGQPSIQRRQKQWTPTNATSEAGSTSDIDSKLENSLEQTRLQIEAMDLDKYFR
jgi:hypothetical protein